MVAFSLVLAGLSLLGTAAIAVRLFWGGRKLQLQHDLSAIHSQLAALDWQVQSAQQKITTIGGNALRAIKHNDSVSRQLKERTRTLEENFKKTIANLDTQQIQLRDLQAASKTLFEASAAISNNLAKFEDRQVSFDNVPQLERQVGELRERIAELERQLLEVSNVADAFDT